MSALRRFATAHVDRLCLLALLLLFAGRAAPFLRDCYAAHAPGGWDGVAHFSLASIYSRRIFPGLSGWVPEYFAGFPFPNFYPPVLYLMLGALHRLGVGDLTAYWIVETGFAAAVPLCVFACARRLSGRSSAALLAGVLATTYMLDDSQAASLGISLRSTFDLGEASHLPAFVFLLLFYYWFLEAPRSRRAAALSAALLALVPLTNVHVVWNAALLFLTTAAAHMLAATDRRAVALRLVGIGAVAVALAGVWVLPMLSELRWAPTLAMEPPRLGLVASHFLHLTAYVVLATVLAVYARAPLLVALGATAACALGLGVLPASHFLGDVAIQPVRILAAYRFLAAPLCGWLVCELAQLLSLRHARTVAIGVAVSLILLSLRPLGASTNKLTEEQEAAYARVLDALAGRTDGRVLIEHGTSGGDNFALQALVGRAGAYSLSTVFREAALDVLFAVPLRNALSGPRNREEYAVDSKIPSWRTPVRDRLERADRSRLRLFNVKYLAATSDEMKALLDASPEVERISEPALWQLYALREPPAGYAAVPAVSPILTYAAFSVKRRPMIGFDFVRLGEEAFVQDRLDLPLVLARTPLLDEPWDARYATALITQYRYRDLDRALAQIESYTEAHTLVALADDDPLYARLVELAPRRPGLRLVPRTSAAELERLVQELVETTSRGPEAAREYAELSVVANDCRQIFTALDEVKRPTGPAPRVASVRFDGERTEIELEAAPAHETPVWIKQGYFPLWRHDGEPVELATPTFQLTWARPGERRLALTLAHAPAERAGDLLGIMGLLGIGVLLGVSRRTGRI
jgi:hypothetical protein